MVLGYGNHIKELKAYCMDSGIEMHPVEVRDRLVDLVEMTATLKGSPDISGLIIWDSSDFGENETEYYYWLQEFTRRKVTVTVVNEIYSADIADLVRSMARYGQSIAHTKGVVMAHVKSKENGISMGATPYGYKRVGGSWKIVPHEAAAIKLAFKLKDKGRSYNEIAETLNNEGYMSKKGGPITKSAVVVWINNRKLYEGYRHEGETWVEGSHEPIL